MAVQKFLYLNTTEGVAQEQSQTSDEILLARITLNGVSGNGINAQNTTIINVPTPVNPGDAANKSYVDSTAQGLSVKPSVVALASTTVSTLSGTLTVDGVALVAGNRVLLTAQTTASQNGIWVVATGTWTRPTDFATATSAAGSFTFVESGTTYASQGWVCTNSPSSAVVDTNNLAFTQFTGLGEISVGNGLVKSLNTISVSLGTNPGLQFTGGALTHLLTSGGGLQTTASGLQLFINASPNTLTADTNGLRVTGLPNLFLINGTAVSGNVIATNLNAVCGGSTTAADAQHTHAAAQGALALQATLTNGGTACNLGDPVCWGSTANTLARGDCSAVATSRVIGLCGAAIAASGTGLIIRAGIISGCLSSATPGAPYFLASGGGLTATCPTGSQNRVVRVGYAVNTTDLEVRISDAGMRM